MAVVIDEVVTETGDDRAAAPPAREPARAAPAREVDLDRLAYRLDRRRHRAARLWAD